MLLEDTSHFLLPPSAVQLLLETLHATSVLPELKGK